LCSEHARVIRLTERGRRVHAAALAVHAKIEKEWAAAVGRRRYRAMRDTLERLVWLVGGTARPR
jgi:DNA-binding MarR family transcriptional regulator